MCRRTSVDLPPTPVSASKARDFLGEICAKWELPELRDDLKLAVSELVTNSILHARTPISMNVSVASGHVEVGVRDHDPRPPSVRATRTDLISDLDTLSLRLPPADDPDPRHPSMQIGEAGSVAAGRGLHLLEAVTDEWGVVPFNGGNPGKEVWFVLGIPPGWPHASACACHRADAGFATASGRPVTHNAGPWDDEDASA